MEMNLHELVIWLQMSVNIEVGKGSWLHFGIILLSIIHATKFDLEVETTSIKLKIKKR